jgi:hypothetical protein
LIINWELDVLANNRWPEQNIEVLYCHQIVAIMPVNVLAGLQTTQKPKNWETLPCSMPNQCHPWVTAKKANKMSAVGKYSTAAAQTQINNID